MVHVFQWDFSEFSVFMSEHRDSGAAAPALQQSLEQQSLEQQSLQQQALPVARGLPGAWGTGDLGWGSLSGQGSHPHCHQQQPAGHQRTEQQVGKGWSSPGWEQSSQGWDGMGWRVLKQGKNKGRRM